MKTVVNLCITVCIIIFFYACNGDSTLNLVEKSDKLSTMPTIDEEPDEEPTGGTPLYKSLAFIYKGNTYSTVPTFEDTIIFYDEQTRLLFEKIQKIPTLCTHVRSDGIIEYFDSFEDFKHRPFGNIEAPPYEPLGETPKITYEFNLSLADSDIFTTKGVIINNKELYQYYHDLAVVENGKFFKKGTSFTFSMINEKMTTSDIIPKWPVQYKFWLVFFDKEKYEGKTIAYNPNIHYSLDKRLVISEKLSDINWNNRIACVLIMMTPF
mgnify:CR=1 FL=1